MLHQHHAFFRDRAFRLVLGAEQHLAMGGARGDHREAVLGLVDHDIEDECARRLDHLADRVVEIGGVGDPPADLDDAIMAMLNAPADKPVLFDCRVAALANCFPMIPSGKAHNEMLLGDAAESIDEAVTEEGKVMV